MTTVDTTGKPFRVADGDSVVTAQKVFTRMGERLDLTAATLDASVRLDAIMLESVTWQDPEDLAARAAELDRSDARPPDDEDDDQREEPLTVSSEFAQARVSQAGDGDRLAIEAPKLGYSIELGPRELEWLAHQDHTTFSEWLETPFGPGGDDHGH